MKAQIPLFRAKKVNSDEYIEGCGIDENFLIEKIKLLRDEKGNPSLEQRYEAVYHQIDPSTLSIHFPDMLDSEGTKIFASLSEDGKGGDIVNDKSWGMDVVFIQARRIYAIKVNGNFLNAPKYLDALVKKDLKVIGIQE